MKIVFSYKAGEQHYPSLGLYTKTLKLESGTEVYQTTKQLMKRIYLALGVKSKFLLIFYHLEAYKGVVHGCASQCYGFSSLDRQQDYT